MAKLTRSAAPTLRHSATVRVPTWYPMGMPKENPVRRRIENDPRWTSHIVAAPGELRIVQAFVNTAVLRTRTEELAGPQALGRWLARWRLVPEDTEPTAADLKRAIGVREGVRALLWANNGIDLDRDAVARLDRAAADIPLRLRVDGEGVAYLTAASEQSGALGRLLGIFATARLDHSWPRFKACADLTCGSAFYDVTKNHSARWCSPRCSNRTAARAWRRRRSTRA